ncbi:OPT family small oligopeptide transporter [Gaeumannomyces tritici R3-111a-1]|uniref:OPT family small oligopeptide transporter n=1 Tax=Gaeumannomyces tritici (strain R3-111a-1) TaxID=644352 RepID=J3PCD9_GAET3|nr:OPT family small oligopeptide transporter [Gaeumannomyces tritici R3-111a-1]EJT71909.1 OPT family small oligopeptide transporter [Gaeumannomyces tritici R3-111a-1]
MATSADDDKASSVKEKEGSGSGQSESRESKSDWEDAVLQERRKSDSLDESSAPSADILFAAGIGLKEDDPTLPCLTIRIGVNTLYTFRFPSITLSQSAIQFLAYPLSKGWEMVVPDWGFNFRGTRHSLNPGPFNYKENIFIYILANLSFATRLSADALTEQRHFYGLKAGWGFELLITLCTLGFGMALAGIFRSLIADPAGFVWPGVLSNTAFNHALHSRKSDKESVTGQVMSKWSMSRYRFFMIAFCASFCWYWFPHLIFPALGYFTFICWIAPNNMVINQVFGMKSGMGLPPITFDGSQITYIGSPLVVPAWAILNILASLVFWIYIVPPSVPGQRHLRQHGQAYNVSRVIDKKLDFSFNHTKYEQYSPLYVPVTYTLNTFGLCFATLSSLFVWLYLEKCEPIMGVAKASSLGRLWWKSGNGEAAVTLRNPQSRYSAAPTWWYWVLAFVSLGMGIFCLRWHGAIFSLFISLVFFVPLAWVYATTNIKIKTEILCRITAGYVYEGKVLANIWFFGLGFISGIKGLAFAQDLKLGIYCNIPPRKLFLVQCVGMAVGGVTQVGVVNWALENIPNICTNKAANGFNCPFSRTHFNTSLIWGGVGLLYNGLLYFFLLGALLPVAVWGLKRFALPRSRWFTKVHVPLFLGDLNFIPPATGTNHGSWAIVGLIFGLYWQRYNFVLDSALDCSLAIAGVFIFFTLFYTGAVDKFSWWGTEVYKNTCD